MIGKTGAGMLDVGRVEDGLVVSPAAVDATLGMLCSDE